jgi:hypothetical protein
VSRQCWYAISGEKAGDRCKEDGRWRFTKEARELEPLLPLDALWCDKHAKAFGPGLVELTESFPQVFHRFSTEFSTGQTPEKT